MTREKQSASPRTKPAEVRLEELMDAAEQLFIHQGFEATTVSDIVRDAGVAKGTFYHYFPSKTEILIALRDRFTREFMLHIQQAVDACQPEDHHGRLRAWCHSGVEAYFAEMVRHDALYHDHHAPTRGNQDRDLLLDQITTILQQGKWGLSNPRLTALLMYHGMHGAVDDAMVNPDLPKETLGDALAEQFLRLLE